MTSVLSRLRRPEATAALLAALQSPNVAARKAAAAALAGVPDPEARAAFLAAGVGGRSFMEPIRAFHAVSAGLQLGLSELHGLDMRPLDLTAALDLLLNGPPALPDA